MPDAHVGFGATVGSVIPTAGAVIPAAVGVDIGCGMIAAELDVTERPLPDDARAAARRIERGDPRRRRARATTAPARNADAWLAAHRPGDRAVGRPGRPGRRSSSARSARATTSSSCASTSGDRVWVVLHSGTRGIGNQLAQKHIGTARKLATTLELRSRTPTSRTSSRARRSSTPTSPTCCGPRTMRVRTVTR